eukprot:1190121-Prorocentrum_minimum.AAC.2
MSRCARHKQLARNIFLHPQIGNCSRKPYPPSSRHGAHFVLCVETTQARMGTTGRCSQNLVWLPKQAVHAAEGHDERLRGFDAELTRELKRRGAAILTSGASLKPEAPPYRQYSFSSYQTLDWPGLNPPPSQVFE